MPEATPPDGKQLLNTYIEDIHNERDFAKIPDVFSKSLVLVEPGAEIHGPAEFESYLRGWDAAFPDYRITIDHMLASDEVIMCEFTFTGTHEGKFNEIPPTGREVEVRGMSKFRIVDGKFEDYRAYWDQQNLLAQLGLTE